jgi:hypothetical protein
MKYSSMIDNVHSSQWGLSIQEAYLFDWLYSLPSWAQRVTMSGEGGAEDFYFASRNKAIEELPLLTDKPDTMYRYYKSLEEKGLIKLTKVGNCDYIFLSGKGKEWNRGESETRKKIRHNSEKNPKKPGFKSDILDNNILDNKDNNVADATSKELFPIAVREPKKKAVKKNAYPDYQSFVDLWVKYYPSITLKFPRDGKFINELIGETARQIALRDKENTPENRTAFWELFLQNLPKTWAQNSDLSVINQKYSSLIKILEDGKKATSKDIDRAAKDFFGLDGFVR